MTSIMAETTQNRIRNIKVLKAHTHTHKIYNKRISHIIKGQRNSKIR